MREYSPATLSPLGNRDLSSSDALEVLDTVVGLGDFVEIEYKGMEAVDPMKTTDSMIAFLKEQECGKIEFNNGGYPYSLLFPEESHFHEA